MSKTYKKEFTRCLLHNGHRNHHNTLLREFHDRSLMGGIWLVKDTHNLLDRRVLHQSYLMKIQYLMEFHLDKNLTTL